MSSIPVWESNIRRGSPYIIWLWMWAGSEGAAEDQGNRDFTLKLHTQGFTCTGTQGKAVMPQETVPDLPVILVVLLGRWRLNVAHWGGKNPGGGCPREYSSVWALLEFVILAPKTWAYLTAWRFLCWDTSGQIINRVKDSSNFHQENCPKSSWKNRYF